MTLSGATREIMKGTPTANGHQILHVVSVEVDDGSITEIIENNHSSREMTSKMASDTPKCLLSSRGQTQSILRPPTDHTTITSYSKSKPKIQNENSDLKELAGVFSNN